MRPVSASQIFAAVEWSYKCSTDTLGVACLTDLIPNAIDEEGEFVGEFFAEGCGLYVLNHEGNGYERIADIDWDAVRELAPEAFL